MNRPQATVLLDLFEGERHVRTVATLGWPPPPTVQTPRLIPPRLELLEAEFAPSVELEVDTWERGNEWERHTLSWQAWVELTGQRVPPHADPRTMTVTVYRIAYRLKAGG